MERGESLLLHVWLRHSGEEAVNLELTECEARVLAEFLAIAVTGHSDGPRGVLDDIRMKLPFSSMWGLRPHLVEASHTWVAPGEAW